MNAEQKEMLRALAHVQHCMYTPSFTQDNQSLKDLISVFELMINEVRISIGQKAIKDYLNE